MRSILITLVVTLPLLVMVACVSISEGQCKTGNWAGIGLADGKAGRSASVLSSYATDCAKVGVTPDRAEWQRGWELGIQSYCTVENAYSQGRRGFGLNNVCSADVMPMLQQANLWGQSYYDIWEEIDDLRDEQRELRSLINAFPADPTPEEIALRQRYRNRLNNLELDILELRMDLSRYDRLPRGMVGG